MCKGRCCQKELQTIAYIKNPPSKSSSQYNAILTADKSLWKIPTNEKSKYDSYVRVLRRRRGVLCC
jgi:hypothetical protein